MSLRNLRFNYYLQSNIMHIGKVDETERNLICYCSVFACMETTANTARPVRRPVSIVRRRPLYLKNIIKKQRIYFYIKKLLCIHSLC